MPATPPGSWTHSAPAVAEGRPESRRGADCDPGRPTAPIGCSSLGGVPRVVCRALAAGDAVATGQPLGLSAQCADTRRAGEWQGAWRARRPQCAGGGRESAGHSANPRGSWHNGVRRRVAGPGGGGAQRIQGPRQWGPAQGGARGGGQGAGPGAGRHNGPTQGTGTSPPGRLAGPATPAHWAWPPGHAGLAWHGLINAVLETTSPRLHLDARKRGGNQQPQGQTCSSGGHWPQSSGDCPRVTPVPRRHTMQPAVATRRGVHVGTRQHWDPTKDVHHV